MTKTNFTWGLGRRKTAVARVRITPGAGAVQAPAFIQRELMSSVERGPTQT